MHITERDSFVATPRMTRDRFVGVLAEAGSPWAGQAGEIHDLIVGAGHDPAIWLAICAREHSYGTNRDSVLWRNDTRSWTNARSVRDPSIGGWEVVHDSIRKSDYVRYANIFDSVRDGMYRVTDPGYRYVKEGRTTIGQVLTIWTESDSAAYTAAVVALMNSWRDATTPGGVVEGLGLTDVRHLLARRSPADGVPAGPYARRPLAEKRGVVVHYSGPEVRDRANTLAVLQAEARYHVDKDWAKPERPACYGDGLMYHVAIGDDGARYLCRDLEDVLWHCGVTAQNETALAVHVPIGDKQRATPAQLESLRGLIDTWRALTGTPVEEVWGHQELSSTDCPGTLMADFVVPYRRGRLAPVETQQWFPETGHSVGGAFWQFWQSRGGLPIFGYPLTDELSEGGQTIQYFERAIFEWHPESDDLWKVQLRRLGAKALATALTPHPPLPMLGEGE